MHHSILALSRWHVLQTRSNEALQTRRNGVLQTRRNEVSHQPWEVGNSSLQKSKAPAGRGAGTQVCFWGKVIAVLGNLTTAPGGKEADGAEACGGKLPADRTGESSQCRHPSPAINHAEAI